MEDSSAEPRVGDAFGAALLDGLAGLPGTHIIERDDGFVDAMEASPYFLEPEAWTESWSAGDLVALDLVGGRVLDIGAGAGRHSLAFQARDHDPVALDVSPGAIEVCKERGIRRTFLGPIDALAQSEPRPFDSAALMGHNLALLGSAERSGPMFDTLRCLLVPGGTVVGTCLDPYLTDDPDHLAHHESNRRRGRLPGQLRLRIRYRHLASTWFDWLFQSPDELAVMAGRAGWRLDDVTDPAPSYLAVLRPA